MKFIWVTEEYATKTLISLWKDAINLLQILPRKEKIKKKIKKMFKKHFKIKVNPYLPSLSIKPAKIIEPKEGDSPWAFGSHKWTKNIGSLIIKTEEQQNKKKVLKFIIENISKLS